MIDATFYKNLDLFYKLNSEQRYTLYFNYLLLTKNIELQPIENLKEVLNPLDLMSYDLIVNDWIEDKFDFRNSRYITWDRKSDKIKGYVHFSDVVPVEDVIEWAIKVDFFNVNNEVAHHE